MRSYYCGLLMFTCTVLGTAAPILSIQPASPTASVGGTVTANVSISGVADLFGFQFDVVFDATRLEATSVAESGLFAVNGVFFSAGVIDNTAGTISFIADSLAGAGPGLSGSDTLATVQFKALAEGLASFNLANVMLLDSSLGDIAGTASGGSVAVGVPEPGAIGFVGLGLFGVALGGRRRGPASEDEQGTGPLAT